MDLFSPEALRGALPAGLDGTALAELRSLMAGTGLTDAARPIRIRLASSHRELNQALLVQRIDIREAICEGLQGEVTCVSLRSGLPLTAFEGLPVEIQLVTDRGQLRPICAVVRGARAGQSDQGLATYLLEIADVLTLFDMQVKSRNFCNKSVIEITETILSEWRQNALIARAFDFDLSALDASRYPKRAFTRQHNVSTRSFTERLWRQNGIFWAIRPGRVARQDGRPGQSGDDTPVHTLVLFDDAMALPQNAAGSVRYQRSTGTEERDCVSLWTTRHTLVPGSIHDQSWDYKAWNHWRMMQTTYPTQLDQGESGNVLAAILEDAWISAPHAGDSRDHFERLGSLRIQHHESRERTHEALADIRDLAVAEWNTLAGHPDFDALPEAQRQFVVTHLRHRGENNLPKSLNERAQALLAGSGWAQDAGEGHEDQRYTCRFTAVPRDRAIVPEWNEARYFPRAEPVTALVVGPVGEEVHCDEQGRIKVQFPGLRPKDHAHAQGAGTTGTDADSAWVRYISPWAGDGRGQLTLPRAGDELIIFFLGGDPDKPIALSAAYSTQNMPPSFSQTGSLPGNRYLSGLHSREVHGNRYNQLRLDDTPGEISAQLESQHGASQLNLGHLTHPRVDGKGEPRGEGLEARTDGAAVVRGKQGVFLSAEEQPRAGGNHLARDVLLGVSKALTSVAEELGKLAATHHAGGQDLERFKQLNRLLQHWEHGSNTAPDATGQGGAPVVALSGPAGILAGSADNLALAAQTTVDIVSGGNTQMAAGKEALVYAAEGVNVFAHGSDVRVVSAQGNVKVETHKGNVEVNSAGSIHLNAAKEIVLSAPTVKTISQGAQTSWGDGQITEEASGQFLVKSAGFSQTGGGGGSPTGVNALQSALPSDEQFVIRLRGARLPAANRRYEILLNDGRTIAGRADDQGRTSLTQDQALSIADIKIFED